MEYNTTTDMFIFDRKDYSVPSESVKVLQSEPGLTIEATSAKEIWGELCKDFNDNRKQIEEYKIRKKQECDTFTNPTVQYLEDTVLPLLNDGLIRMLEQAIKEDCLLKDKTTFNGIDYLSEFLWNMNPQHPERKNNWTYIFDMDWVKDFLRNNPRKVYPFSRVWSRNFAAIKIQAYMRGYWVRRREEVQEVRQFWKVIDGPNKRRKHEPIDDYTTLDPYEDFYGSFGIDEFEF